MRRFLALTLWCLALLTLRLARTGYATYVFLFWNLILAAIPLGASIAFERASRPAARAIWFALWLVFLPNAPYVLTDLMHLRVRPPVPLWFDLALLLSFGGTGLLFAYASLAKVQTFIAQRFGVLAGWGTAVASLVLSAFGIYLGRFQRWNSWDVVTNPIALFADVADRIANPLAHPQTLGVTMIFGAMLTLGYVATAALSGRGAER